MPRLTGPGATMVVAAILIVLLFAVAFSFRDTIRAVAEFFDIRAVRRYLRRPWRAAGTIVTVLGMFVLLWLVASGPDDSLYMFVALVPLMVVPILAFVWLILTDVWQAFQGPRKRDRRKHRHK